MCYGRAPANVIENLTPEPNKPSEQLQEILYILHNL